MAIAVGAGVKSLVLRAKRAAQRRGQRLSTAHLLLVMLQHQGEAGRVLADHGVRESDLLSALKSIDTEAGSTLDRLVERSSTLARTLGHGEVRPMHVLLAITRDSRSAAHRSLRHIGMGPRSVHDRVLDQLGGNQNNGRVSGALPPEPRPSARRKTSSTPSARPARRPTPPRRGPSPRKERAEEPPRRNVRVEPAGEEVQTVKAPLSPFDLDPGLCPTLTTIGRNLTAAAHDGCIDPVIGREAEIEQLLDILARRRANNPIVVGPPGVGKTAVVEGLALAIAKGGPTVRGLADRIIIEISAGGLVSGTGVRGALSDRIKQIRAEVVASRGRVVLFIDEIHAVVGGGEGPDDLAHELKAALARGELPCIGATTDAEFRKHFERDAALARRFSPVRVAEPSESDAIAILTGVAPHYAEHHGVSVDEDALKAAVTLTARYVPERRLPDKAIGALDLASARVRRRGKSRVDVPAIAAVVSESSGVSVERLLMRDGERLLQLESLLGERVIGHHDVIAKIAQALRKSAAGLGGRGRPLGTFLLLGPTGVGKTETAKAVSEVFFPGSEMTRLDMSEFSESHTVARLLGAPPGYVGHDAGGQLTESVRKRPYQLVLLDEVEKAHPDVLVSLLALLDEGRMTDGRGRTVDFTNVIVMMTSNLGATVSSRGAIGFGDATHAREEHGAAAIAAARSALPPELWNRIDEPLHFGSLSRENVVAIAELMLRGVARTLAESRGVTLTWTRSVVDTLIAQGGFDPSLGARPMRRTIGRLLESPLASVLLAGAARDEVRVDGDGEQLSFF